MKNSRRLLIMLAFLLAVMLATVLVIYNYNGPANQLHRNRKSGASPEIIHQMLVRSAALFQTENYPEAERSLKRILNLDPGNSPALRMLGNVYFLSGRYYDASNIFRLLIARNPRDAAAHNNLGQAMVKLQWYEAGIRELLTARALDPSIPMIDLNLSAAYESLGDHDNAQRYLQRARQKARTQTTAAPPQNATEEPQP